MPWLINPTQLDKFRKSQKSVVILDTSWHLPAAARDAKKEFAEKHIIDAQFLDLNLFHDPNHAVPNMLIQDETLISEKLSALGIRDDYKIIFYDNSDLHTACRAFWMFRIFGHNPHQLYILDGGLAAWEKYGGKTEAGDVNVSPKQYQAAVKPEYIRTLAQMKMNCVHPSEQVIDVRHPLRFAGGKDPRPGTRPGHLPGSFCFPYTNFFDAEGKFFPFEKIRRSLTEIGVELSAPIVSTCGSGMTAPILNVVLDLANFAENNALYDGSWSEWGAEALYAGESSLAERPVKTSLDVC